MVAKEQGVIAMRRVGLIVALGALLGLLAGTAAASPALAGGRGGGWNYDPPYSMNFDAADCGFPLQSTQPVSKAFTESYTAPDGSMIFFTTGVSQTTWTNPANGKSITTKESGNFTVTFYADGTFSAVQNGTGAFALDSTDAARFGLPGIFEAAGKVTIKMDANGNFTSITVDGRVSVNICAALS